MKGTLIMIACCCVFAATSARAQSQTFNSGPWKTECKVSKMTDATRCSVDLKHDCRGPGQICSFTISVNPITGTAGAVGAPNVVIAQMRADKQTAVSCTGSICFVDDSSAVPFVRGLQKAQTLLVQITTARGSYEFEGNLNGYRASLDKIREWGHQPLAAEAPPPPPPAKPEQKPRAAPAKKPIS